MENQNQETPATPAATPSRWGRRAAIGGVALAAVTAIGLGAVRSEDSGGRHEKARFGMGNHMQLASMGKGRHFGERRFERMLEEIDATPEQSEKLKVIFASVRGEVGPMFKDMRDTREEIADLLGAPTIDRAAAEKLRAERVAAIDEASQKMTTAILDAAEILTPEQRKELVEHFKERRGHRRW